MDIWNGLFFCQHKILVNTTHSCISHVSSAWYLFPFKHTLEKKHLIKAALNLLHTVFTRVLETWTLRMRKLEESVGVAVNVS